MAWHSKVKLKHLLTEGESHEEVQANMTAIADVLDSSNAFILFPDSVISKMRNIPQGDDIFKPVDYANRLLNRVYDFADEYRIWIE
jgi:hypothetical protein